MLCVRKCEKTSSNVRVLKVCVDNECCFLRLFFLENWNHKFLLHLAWMAIWICVVAVCFFFVVPCDLRISAKPSQAVHKYSHCTHPQYNNWQYTHQNEQFPDQIAQKLIRMFMCGGDDPWWSSGDAEIQMPNSKNSILRMRSYKVHAKRIRFAFGNDKKWEDECHVNCHQTKKKKKQQSNGLRLYFIRCACKMCAKPVADCAK